jgi:hypothetical protein
MQTPVTQNSQPPIFLYSPGLQGLSRHWFIIKTLLVLFRAGAKPPVHAKISNGLMTQLNKLLRCMMEKCI